VSATRRGEVLCIERWYSTVNIFDKGSSSRSWSIVQRVFVFEGELCGLASI
jgi:hypothetical protein